MSGQRRFKLIRASEIKLKPQKPTRCPRCLRITHGGWCLTCDIDYHDGLRHELLPVEEGEEGEGA